VQQPKPKRARFALVAASPTRRDTPSAVQAPSFLKRRHAQDARLDAQSQPDHASAPPATYFEKQVQSRCGMHALNNLFGARACTEEALDEALQTLAFEAQFADNELVPAAPFDTSLHMDARVTLSNCSRCSSKDKATTR
jgi:hypothetical protein